MSELSIRFAEEADIPAILRFIRGLAEYEHLSHTVTATEESLCRTLFGSPKYAEVLIASLDDVPAGFALFFHNFSTFLGQPGIYLEDLFVLPEYRKHGIGKALLVRLAQVARERQCGRLEWTVLDWNQPSIDFYQRIGATVLPDWRVCRMTAADIARLASTK